MKKVILTIVAVMTASMYTASMASVEISTNDIRTETRFLSDKMEYELNLDDQQYNDVYEINYDFFSSVRNIMNDVAYGDQYALNAYYSALDNRNDNLRYVLDANQYELFINRNYFSRPYYVDNNNWGLEIYLDYEPNFYYYSCPPIFYSYFGGYIHRPVYFMHRYNHPIFNRVVRFRPNSIVPYVNRPEGAPRYNGDRYESGYTRNNNYNGSSRYNNNRSFNSNNRNNNINNNNGNRYYDSNNNRNTIINNNRNYTIDNTKSVNNTNNNSNNRSFNNINNNRTFNNSDRNWENNNSSNRSFNNNAPARNYSNPSSPNNNRSFNNNASSRNENHSAPSAPTRSFSAPSSPAKSSNSSAPSRSFSNSTRKFR